MAAAEARPQHCLARGAFLLIGGTLHIRWSLERRFGADRLEDTSTPRPIPTHSPFSLHSRLPTPTSLHTMPPTTHRYSQVAEAIVHVYAQRTSGRWCCQSGGADCMILIPEQGFLLKFLTRGVRLGLLDLGCLLYQPSLPSSLSTPHPSHRIASRFPPSPPHPFPTLPSSPHHPLSHHPTIAQPLILTVPLPPHSHPSPIQPQPIPTHIPTLYPTLHSIPAIFPPSHPSVSAGIQ